jgi:hypothetical protein
MPSRKFVDYSQLINIVFECLEQNRLNEKMYHIPYTNKFKTIIDSFERVNRGKLIRIARAMLCSGLEQQYIHQ